MAQQAETRYTYTESIQIPSSGSSGMVGGVQSSLQQPLQQSPLQQSSFQQPSLQQQSAFIPQASAAAWTSQSAQPGLQLPHIPTENLSMLFNQAVRTATGLWNDLTKNLGHLTYEVSRGVGKVLHADATSEHRFRTYFRLPPQEQLLAEFQCKFLHTNNTVLEGFCYISYNYFCFAPLITFSRPMSSQMLLITIPLRDIDSIQPAVASASYIPSIPTIQPITNPLARPDAMQLITKDRNAYNFFGFIDCMHAFNVLFHAWKSCDLFSNLLSSSGVGAGVGVGLGAGVGMGVGSQLGQTGLTSQLSGGNISQIGK